MKNDVLMTLGAIAGVLGSLVVIVLLAASAYPKLKPKVLRAWTEISAQLEWPTEQVEERYPNGQLKVRGSVFFDENNNQVKTGTWEYWWEGGTIKRKLEYSQGLLHGRRQAWDPGGDNIVDIEYDRGCITEHVRGIFDTARTQTCPQGVGRFQEGKRDGWWEVEGGNWTCYMSGWDVKNGGFLVSDECLRTPPEP